MTTVYDDDVNLIGASGAVYAMLAAYIVCILFSDTYKIGAVCWITAAVVVAICDTVFAVSTEYHANNFLGARTAYAAHFGGAITGNLKRKYLNCTYQFF
ncbi:unnamed protein product [Enterobius vermicularis]|uniref:Rhomboid domain-containing protein n=1 Tax=Enterobius vermicularis TaxID=51028 RepID=A0A0N4VN54_ENTVE|nr:unnamed protein product [Enterobius vermicularis]